MRLFLFLSLSHSLKLECEKLATEKTEIQRHYVMVSEGVRLKAFFRFFASPSNRGPSGTAVRLAGQLFKEDVTPAFVMVMACAERSCRGMCL